MFMCKGLEIYSCFMFHMLLRTFPFADLASWTSDLYMRNIESNSVVLVFERHCTMDNLHSVPSGTTGQIYSGATNTRLNLLPSYSLAWVIEIQVFSSPRIPRSSPCVAYHDCRHGLSDFAPHWRFTRNEYRLKHQ